MTGALADGAFAVLLLWLDGALEYHAPSWSPGGEVAAVGRGRSFGLVVHRNRRLERLTRNMQLQPELAGLHVLPLGEAVNRLIGYDDGPRFVPGIAGLQPAESRVLRWRRLEYRPVADVARLLGCKPHTVHDHLWSATRKLRRHLGLEVERPEPPAAAGPVVNT